MATLRSSFSLPLRYHRVPPLNSATQRRNLHSPHRSYHSSAIHRSHRSACSVSLQNPRSRIPNNRSRIPSPRSDLFCFRCGGYSHFARFCRNPIRCFSCGEFGHRRFNCSKTLAPKLTPNRCSGGELEDVSWILQASQSLDFGERVDYMLLDPAVGICNTGYSIGLENSNPAPSTELGTISEGPIGEASYLDNPTVLKSKDFEGKISTFNSRCLKMATLRSSFSLPPRYLRALPLNSATQRRNLHSPHRPSPTVSGNHKGVDSANGHKGFYLSTVDLGLSLQKGEWANAIPRSLPAKVCLKAFLYRLKAANPAARGILGSSTSLWNLSDIRIIDKLREVGSAELLGESQGAISLYIKPCKFFLYCFLAAFRNQVALPPIGSWKEQLFSVQSSFISSSPDDAAVDRCIFGSEKVFSRKSPSVKCKKKLPFVDSIRRSPRLSRRPRSDAS